MFCSKHLKVMKRCEHGKGWLMKHDHQGGGEGGNKDMRPCVDHTQKDTESESQRTLAKVMSRSRQQMNG